MALVLLLTLGLAFFGREPVFSHPFNKPVTFPHAPHMYLMTSYLSLISPAYYWRPKGLRGSMPGLRSSVTISLLGISDPKGWGCRAGGAWCEDFEPG